MNTTGVKQNKGVKEGINNKLKDFLMFDEGFIPIEDAIKEADKKWPRNN